MIESRGLVLVSSHFSGFRFLKMSLRIQEPKTGKARASYNSCGLSGSAALSPSLSLIGTRKMKKMKDATDQESNAVSQGVTDAVIPKAPELKPIKKIVKRSIEQEIEAAAAKLRSLQEQQREMQKRQREKNERAVKDFIKDEKLDSFGVAAWRVASTEIRAALERATTSTGENGE